MRALKTMLLATLLLAGMSAHAQDRKNCLLDEEAPANPVLDLAGVIPADSEARLNRSLIEFERLESTSIVVVTVQNLCGMDRAMFTYELGEKWKVGHDKKDNGIVVMVKPKEVDGKGETYIAVGYGLEGAVPDAITNRIVENEMIPHFKKKQYGKGIEEAVTVLRKLSSGEFTADEYDKTNYWPPIIVLLVVFGLGFLMLYSYVTRARKLAREKNIGFWVAWAIIGGATRQHRGMYDDFRGGRGRFRHGRWGGGGFGGGSSGGGGGGFGGFGGGSFGGGGAGGSW